MSFIGSIIAGVGGPIAASVLGAGALGAGASVFGSMEQSKAEGAAANEIAGSTQNAIGAETGFVNQGIGSIQSLLGPYASMGTSIMPLLQSLLTPGSNQTAALSQTPGFQFAQSWGQKGINNAASVSGLGGNVLTAGANYSSGLAQNTWQNTVGGLQSLLNTGAGAAGTAGTSIGSLLGSAGSNIAGLTSGAGQNIASTLVGQGNATAAGITGAAGQVGGSLSSLGNLMFLQNLLKGGGSNSAWGGANVTGLPQGMMGS